MDRPRRTRAPGFPLDLSTFQVEGSFRAPVLSDLDFLQESVGPSDDGWGGNNPVVRPGDQITFGGSTTMTSTNGGGSDAIVGKLDAAGKYVFGTKFTSTNVTFTGVGVDGAGNLYVDGTFTGTLNFGSGPLTAQNYDLCVAKLGPTGTVIWGKKFGAGGNESATQLVVDAAGNVDVIGKYDAAFNLGLGNLTFVGPSDMFRARLDSNGVVQSSKGWGSGSPIYAQSAIHDSEGHLVIAGSFGGSVDFGNGTITANQTSMFVTTFP